MLEHVTFLNMKGFFIFEKMKMIGQMNKIDNYGNFNENTIVVFSCGTDLPMLSYASLHKYTCTNVW